MHERRAKLLWRNVRNPQQPRSQGRRRRHAKTESAMSSAATRGAIRRETKQSSEQSKKTVLCALFEHYLKRVSHCTYLAKELSQRRMGPPRWARQGRARRGENPECAMREQLACVQCCPTFSSRRAAALRCTQLVAHSRLAAVRGATWAILKLVVVEYTISIV